VALQIPRARGKLNLIVARLPTFTTLAVPSVRKTTFAGTCVESPKALREYAPVGIILVFSRLEMVLATVSIDGKTIPISLSICGYK
jgi:hypothetical protein